MNLGCKYRQEGLWFMVYGCGRLMTKGPPHPAAIHTQRKTTSLCDPSCQLCLCGSELIPNGYLHSFTKKTSLLKRRFPKSFIEQTLFSIVFSCSVAIKIKQDRETQRI